MPDFAGWKAHCSQQRENEQVHSSIHVDGGAPRPIPGLLAGESVAWTSDPNFLYVFQRAKSSIRVFRLNMLTGQRKFFKEITVPDGPGVCEMTHVLFSPDGRAYAYGYIRLLSDLYLVAGLK